MAKLKKFYMTQEQAQEIMNLDSGTIILKVDLRESGALDILAFNEKWPDLIEGNIPISEPLELQND